MTLGATTASPEATARMPEAQMQIAVEEGATIEKIKGGDPRIEIPVYSHAIYDIVPRETTTIDFGARSAATTLWVSAPMETKSAPASA